MAGPPAHPAPAPPGPRPGRRPLAELHQELAGYLGGTDESVPAYGVVLALRYRRGEQEARAHQRSGRHGTDVTAEELAIEPSTRR